MTAALIAAVLTAGLAAEGLWHNSRTRRRQAHHGPHSRVS